MSREIRVSIDGTGQYKFEPLKDGQPYGAYIPTLIQKHAETLVYVIEGPLTFNKVIEGLTTHPGLGGMAIILKAMQKLRLCILRPVQNTRRGSDTAQEKGSVENRDITTVLQAWHEAFELVPNGHNLTEIQFDLTIEQPVDLTTVKGFVYEACAMWKAKSEGSLRFTVLGCSEEDQAGIEQDVNSQ